MQNAESPHFPPLLKGGVGGIKLYRKTFEKFFEDDINREGNR